MGFLHDSEWLSLCSREVAGVEIVKAPEQFTEDGAVEAWGPPIRTTHSVDASRILGRPSCERGTE
jgi:hypothetical protein